MSTSQAEIKLARESFQQTGKLPEIPIRPEIFQSWKRSRECNVTLTTANKRVISQKELQTKIAHRKNFFAVAVPFMESLYQFTTGSRFLTSIFDHEGYVLKTFGDAEAMKIAVENSLAEGCNRSESNIGTNGIGTALASGTAIQIIWEEHYFPPHHNWVCSGAPVFDANGIMVGGICISGHCEQVSFHTLGMVSAAAQAITQQLVMRDAYETLERTQKNLNAVVTTWPSGILLLNQEFNIVMASAGAARLLCVKKGDLIGVSFRNIVSQSNLSDADILSGVNDRHAVLEYNGVQTSCSISVKVSSDKEFVIFFEKIENLHRRVNRVIGSDAKFTFTDIIGGSEELKKTIKMCKLAAQNNSNVLLKGESGTGKEMFAQAIHNASGRRDGPFVAINCGAIPKSLIESELFGYEGGSFTGAKRDGCAGKFELANGGTIFLDEIGDMPFDVQVSLLRVLQSREVSRIGSTKTIKIDVRVISATHQNLPEAIVQNTFRSDLYYRLNVFDIQIPPLRNRCGDISALADYFLKKYAAEAGESSPMGFTREAYDVLEAYAWPGNIRELENAVERAVYLTPDGYIAPKCFPIQMEQRIEKENHDISDEGSQSVHLTPMNITGLEHRDLNRNVGGLSIKDAERKQIIMVLQNCNYNVTKAAEYLGISRRTLYRKLDSYGIIRKFN